MIAIVANFKNESKYLFEWIVFHYYQGVDKFFLIDNKSTDSSRRILDCLSKVINISCEDWNDNFSFQSQVNYYSKYANLLKGKADFLISIDIDEFVGTTDFSLASHLRALDKNVSAIALNQKIFASSGKTDFEPLLVIDRFNRRGEDISSESQWCKVICRPDSISKYLTVHCVKIEKGIYITSDGVEVNPNQTGVCERVGHGDIKLHHYILKSYSEFRSKQSCWRLDGNSDKVIDRYSDNYFFSREKEHNHVVDYSFSKNSHVVRKRMLDIFNTEVFDSEIKDELCSYYSFLNKNY